MKKLFSIPNFIKFSIKNLSFEIMNEPTGHLAPEELEKLNNRLITLAEERLGAKPDFSFFHDAKMLKNKVITICSEKDSGKDLCYTVMSYLGEYRKKKVVHAGVTISLEGNKGMMQLVYYFNTIYIILKNGLFKRIYVTSLTHTPKIFGTLIRAASDVFPNAAPNSEEKKYHTDVKDLFAKTYLKEWQLLKEPEIDENFVIKGFRQQPDGSILYPDTWKTVPKHRDDRYNQRLQTLLDIERGDEILQVGVINGILVFFNNFYLFRKARK